MTAPAKIYSSFAEVARRQGICIAVITETGNTSYQALLAAVDNVAAAMTARGIAARHLIAVNFGRGELYLVALLAASRIGASIVFTSFADADRLARSPDFRLADDRVPPIERGTAMLVDASWYNPLPAMAMSPMPTPEGLLYSPRPARPATANSSPLRRARSSRGCPRGESISAATRGCFPRSARVPP
jgi:hypothetical protein